MNILHVVNGNITVDNGYTQRIKRQERLWVDSFADIRFSVFNTLDWHILKKPWTKKRIISQSGKYCGVLSLDYDYCQGYPISAFIVNPDHYFIHCARKIQSICIKKKIDLIYAENLMCSYMAYWCNKMFHIPYIMDYHGVAPEEFRIRGKQYGKVNYGYYKEIEKKTIDKAAGIVCVSNRFKDYLIDRFKKKGDRIIIAPSCINKDRITYNEEKRMQVRQSLDIENRKVIIYAGGIGYWHCDQEIVKIFSKLVKQDNNLFFIFLTAQKNQNSVKTTFEKNGINESNYYIDSVSNDEVYNYYAAADYGIIIRFDSLVNEVASPTKVIEYMASGLAVISTTNIGDINRMHGMSYLFNYNELSEKTINYNQLLSFINNGYNRKQNFELCKQFLEREYTWESMIPQYKNLFQQVME